MNTKKNVCTSVLFLAVLPLFTLTGCRLLDTDKENEQKYGLKYAFTVKPSKTTVKVGETINIVVTFENKSGKDLSIELTSVDTIRNYELEDILSVVVFSSYEKKPNWVLEAVAVDSRTKKTIEANAIITRTVPYTFTKWGNYKIYSVMFFYLDGDLIQIDGKPVQIKVR